MFYKKTNHKTGTGGELYICLTISFLTLGEAQCDTVIVVIVVTETEKWNIDTKNPYDIRPYGSRLRSISTGSAHC